MLTIRDYLDIAKRRQGFTSDRQLSLALGFAGTSVHAFASHRAWPSDETMVKLAHLAGMDPLQALVDLNVWRAKSPEAVSLYQKLSDLVQKSKNIAAALLVGLCFTLSDGKANAMATDQHQLFQNYTLCALCIQADGTVFPRAPTSPLALAGRCGRGRLSPRRRSRPGAGPGRGRSPRSCLRSRPAPAGCARGGASAAPSAGAPGSPCPRR